MTTATRTTTATNSNVTTIALVGFMGIAMLFVSGFAQSAVLHNAAHDVRHAAGFPCH